MMKQIKYVITFILLLSGSVQAIINGSNVTSKQWRSVVHIELTDPDNGQTSSCTGVIISADFAITTASCVIHEETAKQVSKIKLCIGNKRPFSGASQRCYTANKIFTHHGYINDSGTAIANNHAYIRFNKPLDLNQLNIQPIRLLTPSEMASLVSASTIPEVTWVGFDSNKLSRASGGIKQQGVVNGAEFDYQSRSIVIKSIEVRPGNKYQGLASFIQLENKEWRLLGLVSQSSPDNLISYYPEFNPCDEDPITVNYPKPLMTVITKITSYPVAACSMPGFFDAPGYSELSCKKLLLRELDWTKAVNNNEPVALRQKALAIYQQNNSVDDAGEIYKLLYLAKNSGDTKATLALSEYLIEGKLFTKDTEQATEFMTVLVKQKHPQASLLLAKSLLFPANEDEIKSSSEEKDQQIFSLLSIAANGGIAEAQYLLAQLHQLGIGTVKNKTKAYRWFANAAMQGYADGQYQLGMIWNDGRGVRAYPEVSLFWIRQAAAQGQFEAQNFLGLLKPRS
jgi:hypothetical protein